MSGARGCSAEGTVCAAAAWQAEPQARLQRRGSKAEAERRGRMLRARRMLPEGFTPQWGRHQGF